MIQDIGSHSFDNMFAVIEAQPGDKALAFAGWDALVDSREENYPFPTVEDASDALGIGTADFIYAFSIDETRFFIAPTWLIELPGGCSLPPYLELANMHRLFDAEDNYWKFAYATGLQLARWYAGTRYCGRCGHEMSRSTIERMMECPSCGNHSYPRINPAIIVAVTDGDRLLMTRYANRPYTQRALVAGFCEIGETAEDTVAREVLEETGVSIKNIRYVDNQPWGLSGDLLLGFTAELDGSDEIHIDENELKYAEWVHRNDIFEEEDNLSLTRNLVMRFKRGEL
ncbi:MAG: NAD(+) diphosphatase [Coriobacteriales bacterium]|jgi:NAD+ diphosphatase